MDLASVMAELETLGTEQTKKTYKNHGALSYLPLHEEAMMSALEIGMVEVEHGKISCKTPLAAEYIRKAAQKYRLGFKRRNVRC